MSNCRLTKRVVDAACPRDKGDIFLWDSELRGFGLRVTPAGMKSYVFQYRLKGRPARRMTIGGHGSPWTAELARREAEQRLFQVRQGVDPVEAAKQSRDEQDRARIKTQRLAFDAYADQFVELYLKSNWLDTWKTGQGTLKAIKPHFAGKALDQITRSDVATLLDSYADRPGARKLTHSVLRKLFNWATDRGDLEQSPILGMKAPKPVRARRRVLSPDEIVLLWNSSQLFGEIWGPYFRLLILTLQRRDEVASLDWSEIDMDKAIWSLPAERAKNEHDHRIPLSPLALAELKFLNPKDKGLVFTTTGTTGVSGFTKAKRKLDATMLATLQREAISRGERADDVSLLPWRIHDLRRTGTTNLQALGVPVEVTEAILNHISGTTAGVAGVYNLYRYDPEKRVALDAWSAKLTALLGEKSASFQDPTA